MIEITSADCAKAAAWSLNPELVATARAANPRTEAEEAWDDAKTRQLAAEEEILWAQVRGDVETEAQAREDLKDALADLNAASNALNWARSADPQALVAAARQRLASKVLRLLGSFPASEDVRRLRDLAVTLTGPEARHHGFHAAAWDELGDLADRIAREYCEARGIPVVEAA